MFFSGGNRSINNDLEKIKMFLLKLFQDKAELKKK